MTPVLSQAEVLPGWLLPAYRKLCWPLHQGRLAHAWLLHGPQGVGKRMLARAFAARLLCRKAQAEEPACGRCPECLLYRAGNHPDFYPVSILEDKQAISIEQIRELGGQLQQSAHRSGYRVALLEPAEKMSIGAANALLKTLEEPGARVVLLLVVDELGKLPATIRSRCQRLALAAPERSFGDAWLAGACPTLDAPARTSLLDLCAGAPLLALARHEQGALTQVQALSDGLQALAKGLTTPVAVAAGQSDVSLALDALQRFCLGGIRKSLSGGSPLPAPVWDAFASEVLQATGALRRNASLNGTLLLESVLVQWFDLTSFLRHSKRRAGAG